LLNKAGINAKSIPPSIDERAVEQPLIKAGMEAADIAEVLARAKAIQVSEQIGRAHV